MAAAAMFVFRKNVNNSELDICSKFYGKMHQGHAEMTRPKVETVTDVIKRMSET